MGVIQTKKKSQTLVLIVLTSTIIAHSQTPSYIALYSKSGAPTSLDLLPQTEIIKSGDSFKLVVKVFDENGIWLSKYEDSLTFAGMLRWRISKPIGTLNTTSGYQNIYTASSSDTVSIIVSLNTGNVILSDRIKLSILPGPQYHLWIEGDETPISTTSSPIDTVRLSSSDSAKIVYIVVRDRFGNFVNFASHLSISWNDTNVAKVEIADSLNGRIVIRRSASAGIARMVVSQTSIIPDSCYIKIDSRDPTITYVPIRVENNIGTSGNELQEYYQMNGSKFNSCKHGMQIVIKKGKKKGIAPRLQINK